MRKQVILNRIYTDVNFNNNIFKGLGSMFDITILDPNTPTEYEVISGINFEDLQKVISGTDCINFMIQNGSTDIVAKCKITTVNKTKVTTAHEIIEKRKSIWSALSALVSWDSEILRDNKLIRISSLTASRSTDNIFVKQVADGVFKTDVLFNMYSDLKGLKLLFRLPADGCLAVLEEYPKATKNVPDTDERVKEVQSSSTNTNLKFIEMDMGQLTLLSLDINEFKQVVSPPMILVQQSMIEYYKVEKMACTFAADVMKQIFGISNLTDVFRQRKREIVRGKVSLTYEVESDKPIHAELWGHLYGATARSFLEAAIKGLSNKTYLKGYLDVWMPNNTLLYRVFKQEFMRFINSRDGMYDPTEVVDYCDECDYQLAQLYLQMYELKCMILEYNYLAPELRDGILIDGVQLKITKGV